MKSQYYKLTFLLFPFIFIACIQKQEGSVEATDTIPPHKKNFTYQIVNGDTSLFPGDVRDMVDFYATKDSIDVYSPSPEAFSLIHYLKVFTGNRGKYAVAFESMDKVTVYKIENNKPLKVFDDSLPIQPEYIKITDMNFDGQDDIVITNHQGAHGNLYTYALLYKDGKYIHNEGFDIINYELDKEKKQIRSRIWSSVCGAQIKELYKVTGYEIEVQESYILNPNCSSDGKYSWLYKSKLVNGKLQTDSMQIETNKGWDLLEKSIWETGGEP